MALARVELGSGREVSLSELHLTSTYGGLIEGYPCKRVNDHIVSGLAVRAGRIFPGGPVHVIEPVPDEPEVDPSERWPFGPPQWLPAVTCFGSFSSSPVNPGIDSVLHYSRLVVVWFQAEATVMDAQQISPAVRDLHWDDWAEDEEV